MASRRPDSRIQSEDAGLAAPLLRAEDLGGGWLKLDSDCRPRATESQARWWGRVRAALPPPLLASFLRNGGRRPHPSLAVTVDNKGARGGGQTKRGTWRVAAPGKVGNKGRGLGAAGRTHYKNPKAESAFVSRAAQTCGNPGGPASPAVHLGLIGHAGTMPSPRIQLRGKQVGPGQRPRESLGSPRLAFKGPASSKERLLVSVPSCPASISARCEFCCLHTSIPGG